MRGKLLLAFSLLTLLIPAGAMRADEIRLKDGSKIIGTIVGFENDSFRVETSYGFALIRKDKVADINITPSKKDGEQPSAKSSAPAAGSAPPQSAVPAVVKEPSPEAIALAPMRAPTSPVTSAAVAAKDAPAAPK